MNVAGHRDRVRRHVLMGVGAVALALLATAAVPRVWAQFGQDVDPRFAGLRWQFVRIRYDAHNAASFRARYWSDSWAIDGPAAEQNLSRRIRSVTAIDVGEPTVVRIEDPELFNHPWIYFVEPGTLRLKESEVPILREFLLRGGTAVMDDFHGDLELENVLTEMKRVFPDRKVIQLPASHPIFSCFYQMDGFPQVPGLGSFFAGRTWEKGGIHAELHAIEDDNGRAMVLLNWNTDMGDGWEWSNAEQYPGYIQHTAQAYRMMINEVIYTLTH